jgi:hypothetical protein
LEQLPVVLSHVPAVWHASSGVHTTGVPVHEPDWQVSVVLHLLPSLHGVPLLTLVCVQPVDALHVSVVHWLLSSQFTGAPGVHVPAKQVHCALHVRLPGHGVPSGCF